MQAIGAQEHAIAGEKVVLGDHGLDGGPGSQRLQQDVAERKGAHLLGGQDPLIEQLFRQGLVLGQGPEFPGPQEVATRVAHLCHREHSR